MNFIFNVSLALLLVAAGLYWDTHHNPNRPPPFDLVAAYELQIQRGVAERLIALNDLGKAEILSLHAWRTAQLRAQDEENETSFDSIRSMVSGRFMFEAFDILAKGKARIATLERAKERRVRETEEISAAWKAVLDLSFQRYIISNNIH